jgi:periplasmic copper chaperone A
MQSKFSLLPLLFAGSVLAQTSAPAPAAVAVEGAWARPSVQGQIASGAFMKLTAKSDLKLVSASSPAAGVTEIHEMKMEGDIMKMRAMDALELPAGKVVELKPGSYHMMLINLKAPLVKGSAVPVTLVFKNAKGEQSKLLVSVPVAIAAPGAAAKDAAAGQHKH